VQGFWSATRCNGVVRIGRPAGARRQRGSGSNAAAAPPRDAPKTPPAARFRLSSAAQRPVSRQRSGRDKGNLFEVAGGTDK